MTRGDWLGLLAGCIVGTVVGIMASGVSFAAPNYAGMPQTRGRGGGGLAAGSPVVAPSGSFGSIDAGFAWIHAGMALGDTSAGSQMGCFSSGGVQGECLAVGGASTFVGSIQHKGIAANGGAETALVFGNINTLTSSQAIAQFRNGNLFSSSKAFEVMSTGKLNMANADAGSAGSFTLNIPSGKAAIANGAGSMTLTNSNITAASWLQLTLLSDDTTCVSLYAIPASGSAEIGCAGAATCSIASGCNFAFEVRN